MGTTNPHLHLPFPFAIPCKQKLTLTAIYFLIIPLSLLNLYIFFLSPHPNHLSPPLRNTTILSQEPVAQPIRIATAQVPAGRRCDFADGRWVPDPRPPQYNDTSCKTIKSGQNCMAHGRPDTGYLHWRWKPTGCQLIPFSAAAFLDLLVNKHLAFVGDSLARNQLESLLCLLSTANGPPDVVYNRGDENKFRRWFFRSHNTTLSVYWSPFLVKGIEKSAAEGRTHNQLFLDSADEQWAAELEGIDIVVLSAGHWFLIPGIFYDRGGEVFGCHHCKDLVNMTETGFFDAFRRSVRTAVRTTVGRMGKGKEKMAVVTTFTPAHFEGEWDKAGACARKEPFGEGEKEMEYMDKEMRNIELEEAAAAAAAATAAVRVEVLDVTRMAMMRPDGHPGPYMNPNPFEGGVKERVQNDCLHWCLPGPIDTWNEILLEMVRRWRKEVS
ncbi:hypothetical protein KFK09_013032 [Dendrobium nobile]|uniref:Trichome birefringence-like N-terminal domain-containing protein n=1 Tax=Dendrobium nobile TaxID=94219 RepID=A0A8T3BIZ1_DENNO|nr:hypothetical protein KFK09_013032 [Dendrobium nobile]